MAPNVNAYKRLHPDMLNGYWANWGHDDRSVTVRVPPARGEATRLEQRTADASANPYLVGAAVLHAARFGVEDAIGAQARHSRSARNQTPMSASPRTCGRARGDERRRHGAGPSPGVRDRRGVHDLETRGVGTLLGATNDPDTTDVTDWELRYYLPYH